MRYLFIPAAAAVLLAFTAPPVEPQAALDDPTIVAIFDAANAFDIETGELALSRARSQPVKDLAKQFVNDHEAVRRQGRELAEKLGVTPTPPAEFALAEAHEKAMKELRAKSGEEFDRAYLAHEVAFHQAVLDAVNGTLLPAIRNQELKAFVATVAPAFQGHHAAAEALQRRLEARS